MNFKSIILASAFVTISSAAFACSGPSCSPLATPGVDGKFGGPTPVGLYDGSVRTRTIGTDDTGATTYGNKFKVAVINQKGALVGYTKGTSKTVCAGISVRSNNGNKGSNSRGGGSKGPGNGNK